MALKSVTFKIKGMQRDLAESSFNSEYAYENKNLRIMATSDNTLSSLTNEKGTTAYFIAGGIGSFIEGTPLGSAVLNKSFILFTTNAVLPSNKDRIYKFSYTDAYTLTGALIFRGDLGFNTSYPIETLVSYENEEVQKVYWTDNLNQPRVINIAATSTVMAAWTSTSFDFVKNLPLREVVTITKKAIAYGEFPPGVIQYSFSYFNKYGQESNIVYTSPLLFISFSDRGASPEDKVGNSFTISITGADTSFDYIRVYSSHRSSLNGIPYTKKVVDLAVTSGTMTYVDNGVGGDAIEPSRLLYIGGEQIKVGTLALKDNTLFLGDITVNKKIVNAATVAYFADPSQVVTFSSEKVLINPSPSGYYQYNHLLKGSAPDIKTFKLLETYRFGLLFQVKSGRWSEPVFLCDKLNDSKIVIQTLTPETSSIGNSTLPVAKYTLDAATILSLVDQGFIKVRPVIVYPTINDRDVICLGVVCPTVFNVKDRYSNAPFVLSSWFSRPNAAFDYATSMNTRYTYTFHVMGTVVVTPGNTYTHNSATYTVVAYLNNSSGKRLLCTGPSKGVTPPDYSGDLVRVTGSGSATIVFSFVKAQWQGSWSDIFGSLNPSINSKAGLWDLDTTIVTSGSTEYNVDSIKTGALAEFRHYRPIPGNEDRNGEIQCISQPALSPYSTDPASFINALGENFYVDQSIFTLHSPDLEFDDSLKSLDLKSLKFRIVGIVPITSSMSDINILASLPDEPKRPGFYKEPIGTENLSYLAGKSLVSGIFWIDNLNDAKTYSNVDLKTKMFGFAVYPWHRNGSLNNASAIANTARPAQLLKKRMSNLKFSYLSYYFADAYIWTADSVGGISGAVLFDSTEQSMIKIPAPVNSGLDDLVYYGNVDKILTVSTSGTKKDGYPIIISGAVETSSENPANTLFRIGYSEIHSDWSDVRYSTDPVRMTYKSSPHAVMALNWGSSILRVLPTFTDLNGKVNAVDESGIRPFWRKTNCSISQDSMSIPLLTGYSQYPTYNFLWMGELYNASVTNRFGGNTLEAYENNQWTPAGEPVRLFASNDTLLSSATLTWTEGDTYFQRYDNLKTYPFTPEDLNGVVEIVSFMCETRINLDGRYDRNRGLMNNLAANPTNFNLINKVYSQTNNFFVYRALNYNKLNLNYFPTTITWTLGKTAGEFIDTWTNITLGATIDLDGDKGPVRAIRRFNNELIAFQDTGIALILFNSRVLIATLEGAPIEVGNSGKVDGKKYLANVGCRNKWSIAESPKGLYFIDDVGKAIYLFNGEFYNLSDKFGFHSWINSTSPNTLSSWDPVNFTGKVTYYDKTNGDVFFISTADCLAYSEPLGGFSSFYSYNNVPYFVTLEDKGIWVSPSKLAGGKYRLWRHNPEVENYNVFFDKYEPFYTTIIANPDPTKDKIFNTLEFRADTFDYLGTTYKADKTFNKLTTWNEYQSGTSTLLDTINKVSNLKKKFRIWRANIPRDTTYKRDRMRNPWLYIKLEKDDSSIDKTILHDLTVTYFD